MTAAAGVEAQPVAGFGQLDLCLRQASDWYLWGPTSLKDLGAQSARTTAPTVTPGAISRMITHARAPIGGVRTGLPGSATSSNGCAWRSRCGTGATRY